jgi:hypothetical protein
MLLMVVVGRLNGASNRPSGPISSPAAAIAAICGLLRRGLSHALTIASRCAGL